MQIKCDGVHIPNPAAGFHLKGGFPGNTKDDFPVLGTAGSGAVQIDQMDPRGTGFLKTASRFQRIGGYLMRSAEIPAPKPDTSAVQQVTVSWEKPS